MPDIGLTLNACREPIRKLWTIVDNETFIMACIVSNCSPEPLHQTPDKGSSSDMNAYGKGISHAISSITFPSGKMHVVLRQSGYFLLRTNSMTCCLRMTNWGISSNQPVSWSCMY